MARRTSMMKKKDAVEDRYVGAVQRRCLEQVRVGGHCGDGVVVGCGRFELKDWMEKGEEEDEREVGEGRRGEAGRRRGKDVQI